MTVEYRRRISLCGDERFRSTKIVLRLSVVPIEFTAIELSRPVPGAHKQSELREYSTTWIKEGAEFVHWYPDYENIKEI